MTPAQWELVAEAAPVLWLVARRTKPQWAGTADLEEVRDYGVDEAIRLAVAYRPGGPMGFKNYLRKYLAAGMVREYSRKRHRRRLDSDLWHRPDECCDGVGDIDVSGVLAAVARLAPKQRTVAEAVLGLAGDPVPPSEYAAATGKNRSTVNATWADARRNLRKGLRGGLDT